MQIHSIFNLKPRLNNNIIQEGQISKRAEEYYDHKDDELGYIYYSDCISNINKAKIQSHSKQTAEMTDKLYSQIANGLGKDDPCEIIKIKDELINLFEKKYTELKKSGRKVQEDDKNSWFLYRSKSGDYIEYTRKNSPIEVSLNFEKDNIPNKLSIINYRNIKTPESLELIFDDEKNIISGYKEKGIGNFVYSISEPERIF